MVKNLLHLSLSLTSSYFHYRVYNSDNGSLADLHYHLGSQISLLCEVTAGPIHDTSLQWIFQVRLNRCHVCHHNHNSWWRLTTSRAGGKCWMRTQRGAGWWSPPGTSPPPPDTWRTPWSATSPCTGPGPGTRWEKHKASDLDPSKNLVLTKKINSFFCFILPETSLSFWWAEIFHKQANNHCMYP